MTERARADRLLSFLRSRGLDSLSLVVEHLNRGTSHYRIAQEIGMDEGQFSKFVHAVFICRYCVAPEIADVIDLYQQLEARNAERVKGNVLNMGERSRDAAPGDAA